MRDSQRPANPKAARPRSIAIAWTNDLASAAVPFPSRGRGRGNGIPQRTYYVLCPVGDADAASLRSTATAPLLCWTVVWCCCGYQLLVCRGWPTGVSLARHDPFPFPWLTLLSGQPRSRMWCGSAFPHGDLSLISACLVHDLAHRSAHHLYPLSSRTHLFIGCSSWFFCWNPLVTLPTRQYKLQCLYTIASRISTTSMFRPP
jgi:hypothetical protein